MVRSAASRHHRRSPDVSVGGGGSVYLVTPETPRARDWIRRNVGPLGKTDENHTWYGGALVVEHRYIGDLVRGMEGDGLKVG